MSIIPKIHGLTKKNSQSSCVLMKHCTCQQGHYIDHWTWLKNWFVSNLPPLRNDVCRNALALRISWDTLTPLAGGDGILLVL